MNWDIDSINQRIDELELKKNRLIMLPMNSKLAKDILYIESLIALNKDMKAILEDRKQAEFH